MPEPTKTEQKKRGISLGALIGFALKVAAFLAMFAVPLFGTWSASSLAAYWNGPIAATIGAGLLLFPVLPLAWDAWRERARRVREAASKAKPRARVLTFTDRLVLRTLFLNGAFLAAMVFTWPEALFGALTTRGDWFLDRVEGADLARRIVLRTADGLVWIYDAAHENPYDQHADETEPVETETPVPTPVQEADAGVADDAFATPPDAFVAARDAGVDSDAALADAGVDSDAGPHVEPVPEPSPSTNNETPRWPFRNVVSLIVTAMPASEEASIARVATYLRAHASNDYELARAAHDYIATRVAYDTEALASIAASDYRTRFPQDAASVFRTRRGVCEGYARLFRALSEAMGLEARYVVGDARTAREPLEVEPHAWNAVRIDGAWYLLDVTWDAGGVGEEGFVARYSTDYFLTPSGIFVTGHFPDSVTWQLRDAPITRGEFQRMPVLSPSFYAQGFVLNDPTRAQTEIRSNTFEARVHGSRFLLAAISPEAGGERVDCTVEEAGDYLVHCPVSGMGTFNVLLFANKQRYGQYESIGALQVIRR
jgi:transglutaminase-like putative cysteine protease